MSDMLIYASDWFIGCLLITAASTTLFPLLWMFSPWHETVVGRLIMIRSIAFSASVDLTVYFLLFAPMEEFANTYYLLQTFVFSIITVVSILLTFTMLNMNYFKKRKVPNDK